MKRLDLQWFVVGAVITGAAFAVPGMAADSSSVQTATLLAAPLERPAPSVVQPQRSMLFAITRAGKRLVAVGEHGVIALSDDDGQHWRNARVPVDVNLTAVAFANERQGWAIGHMGVILHSADAGESWQKQLDGISAAEILLAQARQQATTLDESAREDLLLRAEGLMADGPDKPLLDLLVEDPNTVSVVGAFNLALRSTDGGATWQGFSQTLDNPNGMHVYALEKIDGSLLAVGEQGLVLKSAGAEATLVTQQSPYEGSFFGLLAMGRQQVLAYGLRGNAFVSDDAGASWHKTQVPGSNNATFNAALRRSNGDVLLLDQSGRIHVSRDRGRNFRTLAFEWGAPLTGAVETASGSILLSSLAGVVQVPTAALADNASEE
ncbi:glycosyl hydrolase [Pseudomonas capeferrum]|uniref:WD40/YVTN/BNR-like repeat-containing protein n=1 Tax=Pseudomonas capeferrum TaxID=1495066 RepID=UPI0015E43442|nr:YCF48-related protein [Pseudomonas capeferrum]MBA1200391.1 glycosyl hydrolase [Pseudomonas capeferrum]